MPERKWILLSIILLYLAILPACEKLDNYNRISYDYPYHANFAFAIGSSVLNLPKLGRNLPMGWEEHPELLVIPDSIILEDHLPFEPQSWIEQGSTKIAQIVIKIRGYNEFPDWAQLTFMLTDSLNHSIFPDDSLTSIIIREAIFTTDTIPTENGNFETLVIITKRQMTNLSRYRYLSIRASIANKTKHNEQYSYYRYLKIEVGIGVQVQFDFNLQTLNSK